MLAVNADSFKMDLDVVDVGKLIAGFWESLKIQIARFWKVFKIQLNLTPKTLPQKIQIFFCKSSAQDIL